MSFRLSESERALVLLWRAFVAYGNERDAAHRLLEDPSEADEECAWFEVHRDGSGSVVVDPSDPNQRRFTVATWGDVPQAAGVVDAAAGVIRRRREKFENERRARR